MIRMRYKKLIQGEWSPPTRDESIAYKAYLLYFVRCETFERWVCRFRNGLGDAVPITPLEKDRCLWHTRHQRKVLDAKLGDNHRKRFEPQRRLASSLTFKQQKRELQRIQCILQENHDTAHHKP